ncbi:MAG: 16S rRNA (cytosine(1402)-N(4))-methyltransferase RsmH [Deltaproteobacteria bacterium]|nr:MAG: 16S rRNA (cytosine(1402)-N(4))-methyltransferase RsmH [Deltaproteobacteria bacterium]
MAAFTHRTVMSDEIVSALLSGPCEPRWLVDATAGGGGHGEALLRAAPSASLLAVDRDPRALDAVRSRLSPWAGRVRLVPGRFGDLLLHLEREAFGERDPDGAWCVDGMVLDAGVSSPQLDEPERGFSFQRPGPLDMRMGEDGETLGEYLESVDEGELARILREYGEVKSSRRLARAILDEMAAGALQDTGDLARVCERILRRPGPPPRIHPATLPFQALRIAVNDELGELERFLHVAPGALRPGGRLAIISFHSLEDRLVKRAFRSLSRPAPIPRGLPVREVDRPVYFDEVGKLLRPSEHECELNPRARSARLRVLERRSRNGEVAHA